MPNGIEGTKISDLPKLITDDFIGPKATKKNVYIPYIEIHRIVP